MSSPFLTATQNVSPLMMIPLELRFEILTWCDLCSLYNMRGVSRYWRDLIDSNRDSLLLAIIHLVVCAGPHGNLLKRYPRKNQDLVTYAKSLISAKKDVIQVIQRCQITQDLQIDALYCIDAIHWHAHCHLEASLTARPPLLLHPPAAVQTWNDQYCRGIIQSYNTLQLRHMIVVYFRLIFTFTQRLGYNFSGQTLRVAQYKNFNIWVFSRGMGIILLPGTAEWKKTVEDTNQHGYLLPYPMLLDEIRHVLIERRELDRFPNEELQLFFRDVNTSFEITEIEDDSQNGTG